MSYIDEMTIPIKKVNIYEKDLFNKLTDSILNEFNARDEQGINKHLNLLDEKKAKGFAADGLAGIKGSEEIKKIVRQEMVQYCTDLGADARFAYQKLNSSSGINWWNVMPRQSDWYPIHDHRNWFVSAVLYVRVNPNHQPTSFRSPLSGLMDSWFRPAGRIFGKDTKSHQEYEHYGTSGDLLIFPPWLDHSVPPILADNIADVVKNSKLPGVRGRVAESANSSYLLGASLPEAAREDLSKEVANNSEDNPRVTIAFNF
jgi:hypothetical protein